MFTFRKALVALTALAASVGATTLPAAAAEYPEPDEYQLVLDVAHCKIGGTFLRFHAVATSGGEDIPGTMTVTAVGKTFTENDNDLRDKVKTPVVTQSTDYEVEATFVPNNADATAASQSSTQVTQASYSSAALPTAFETKTTSETVTLVPRSVGCSGDGDGDGDGDGNGDSDNGGLLPDTGGISPWFLILGALLLAAGAGVLTAVRRRSKNFV